MVLNAGKCHYVCLRRIAESAALYFNDQIYANFKEEAILDIKIDNKLSFYSHMKGLY